MKKEWVAFDKPPFEKWNKPLWSNQLSFRIKECQQTVNILEKINSGFSIDHLFPSPLDLSQFKVGVYPLYDSKKN